MLGFDIRVMRGGADGETLHYVPPTHLNHLRPDPIELMDSAVEVLESSGYPILFTIRAGDLPYTLGVPDDEIVFVKAWDQS